LALPVFAVFVLMDSSQTFFLLVSLELAEIAELKI